VEEGVEEEVEEDVEEVEVEEVSKKSWNHVTPLLIEIFVMKDDQMFGHLLMVREIVQAMLVLLLKGETDPRGKNVLLEIG